jgi:hypothetical protein
MPNGRSALPFLNAVNMLRDADAPSFLAAVRKLGTPAAVWVTPLISDVGN